MRVAVKGAWAVGVLTVPPAVAVLVLVWATTMSVRDAIGWTFLGILALFLALLVVAVFEG